MLPIIHMLEDEGAKKERNGACRSSARRDDLLSGGDNQKEFSYFELVAHPFGNEDAIIRWLEGVAVYAKSC